MAITKKKTKAPVTTDAVKDAAESSLLAFIKLIAPHRVLGKIHEDLIYWWTRSDAKNHQLCLLPRDHQKSAMIAYRVAWEITKNPAVTILYISSTATLAERQLKFIKDILTSNIYRRYWPEMVHADEGKRARWTTSEIDVDHPLRAKEGVRDATVVTGGLTKSLTGLHCNIAVLDDVVVYENAYTNEGRQKVRTLYSLLSSIETTGAKEWVVGTRYHPSDLYGVLQEQQKEMYDESGNLVSKEPIYEIFQREVEDRGDGTGEYIWPRMQRPDGTWFGFNQDILATKRGQYLDRTQFFAQYYNNPNDPGNEAVSSDYFQYYDRKHLEMAGGRWTIAGKPLNVYAAIDFAFSLKNYADYTALVTVGIDASGCIYVLDIDRFRTNKISEYFDALFKAHVKWQFRKARAEVTVAQEAIVEELKARIRQEGLALAIDKFRPNRNHGTKEERMQAILSPRYENMSIYHYRGGLIEDLELELRQTKPKHDDIKDALANAIEIAIPPTAHNKSTRKVIQFNSRFGGVAARI